MGRRQREPFDGLNLDELIVTSLDNAYRKARLGDGADVAMESSVALAAAIYRLAIAVENAKR